MDYRMKKELAQGETEGAAQGGMAQQSIWEVDLWRCRR